MANKEHSERSSHSYSTALSPHWDLWCVICHRSALPPRAKGPRDDMCHPRRNILLSCFSFSLLTTCNYISVLREVNPGCETCVQVNQKLKNRLQPRRKMEVRDLRCHDNTDGSRTKKHPFKCHENAHDLLWNIFFSNYPQELGRVNCRGLELVGVKWRKHLIKRVALDPPPSFVPLTGVFPHEFVFKSSRRGREPVTENREFFHQPFFARHHLPLRENIISFCAWSSAFVLLLLLVPPFSCESIQQNSCKTSTQQHVQ